MEKKLEVKDLRISFRTQSGLVKAVRDISFDLYKGETLAIVGESGSGKSVTSKAVIGILSGNAIVEGGEILYDGQDLLKISEENFHKIRGDKISMIFQDPLSSLNPIMRVGKQLTEAMILNGKARQKNARKDFNYSLHLLRKNLDEVNPSNASMHAELCKTFDNFCIESTHLELAYNNANADATALKSILDNLLFLIEKKQKVDYVKEIKTVIALFRKTIHDYVVSFETEAEIEQKLSVFVNAGNNNVNVNDLIVVLKECIEILNISIAKQAPNFFRLGYCCFKNKDFQYKDIPVVKLDEMTRKILDEEFMLNFINVSAEGIKNSHLKSLNAKKDILREKEKYLNYFSQEHIVESEAYKMAKELYTKVNSAINRLAIRKNSIEYSFESTILHDLNTYFAGLDKNPKMQAKYERQLAKYNNLISQGKKPTWQVTPAIIVDLKLARDNIIKVITTLFDSYESQIKDNELFDGKIHAVELIDYLKELASRVVYKITKRLAKAKAIDLMKEVGIPEPNIRFKQYPFEFSGGMRQRIVIAIALSANPDILICDEPTTALDVTIQSQILELINKIKKERNLSVIFITHDLGVVANMADRVAVMYAGKIVEFGTSDDIFYEPKHPYTWALLSSMPDLDTKEKLEAIPGTPPNMIYPPKGDAFAERNKYAMEIDFEMQPPLFKVSETHYAATWLLHPNAPKVKPPKIVLERIKRMKKEAKM